MKKFFTILLSAMMVFSLAACSGQNGKSNPSSGNSNGSSGANTQAENNSEPAGQSSEPSDTASSESPSDTPSTEPVQSTDTAGGKTLVVYYSATNNTEAIAG